MNHTESSNAKYKFLQMKCNLKWDMYTEINNYMHEKVYIIGDIMGEINSRAASEGKCDC